MNQAVAATAASAEPLGAFDAIVTLFLVVSLGP